MFPRGGEGLWVQGTKIFQYCTCPTGRVTYNFHLSCKHMHLSFKSICNKEHKVVICYMTYKVPYIAAKMIFTQSVSSLHHIYRQDFTVKTQKMILVSPHPRLILPEALFLQDECFGKNYLSFLDFTRNYERTSGTFVPWGSCLTRGTALCP